jgi:hypothetical protein
MRRSNAVVTRTLVSLSACVTVAALVAAPLLNAEPLRPQARHGDVLPTESLRDWSLPTADSENSDAPQNVAARVASALTPLDLRKLSMSDFGVVDQGR